MSAKRWLAGAAIVLLGVFAPRARAGERDLRVGGFIGWEADEVSGPTLRADGERPLLALGEDGELSLVGSLGFAHLTKTDRRVVFTRSITATVVKAVPAARLSYAVTPSLSLFADAGVGAYWASLSDDAHDVFGPVSSTTDSELALMLRLGGGAWIRITEKARIGAAIELDPYLGGKLDRTTFLVQAGAMFRL